MKINKSDVDCAPAESLKAECTGTGIEVENPAAVYHRPKNVE